MDYIYLAKYSNPQFRRNHLGNLWLRNDVNLKNIDHRIEELINIPFKLRPWELSRFQFLNFKILRKKLVSQKLIQHQLILQ